MPDWEPAPPSAELRKMAATFRTDGKAQIRRADMFDRLAADDRIPLDRAQLDAALADKAAFTGAAQAQVADVVTAAEKLIARYPDAAQYAPAPIL